MSYIHNFMYIAISLETRNFYNKNQLLTGDKVNQEVNRKKEHIHNISIISIIGAVRVHVWGAWCR